MTLQENLSLERYRLITDRQKYFTELARNTYSSYVRVFVALAGGAVTLTYFKEQLEVDPQVITSLLQALFWLMVLLAAISTGQVIFCLVRWYGLRNTERQINPECPKAEWWAWIFEALYVAAIWASILVARTGLLHFIAVLDRTT